MPYDPPRPFGASEIIVVLPKDEIEWKAARSLDVTASVAAGLMGIHPYTTPYRIWAQKTGRMTIEPETKAMRRGTLLEPVAVEILRDEKPDWRVEYRNDRAYYRAPALRLGATPDCFAFRPDIEGRGTVQIKTVSSEALRQSWRDPDTGDIVPPLWIAVQTIIEARLTGSTWASVAAFIWDKDALDIHVIDIPINEGVFRKVSRRVAEFWSFVETDEEMDPDWGRDGRVVLSVYADSVPDTIDLAGIDGMDKVLARYIDLGRIESDARSQRETLKPQIIFALGNAERGTTDQFTVKAPTVRKDSYEVKEQTYRSLTVRPRRDR